MSMYCPACGQERISDATNYCSRCGFLLSGAAELLTTGGILPIAAPSKGWRAPSPRNRGLKQGLFIFLLTFLIVPIISIFTIAANAEPFAVVIAAILLTVGGLLRMAYALMFQSPEPANSAETARGPVQTRSIPNRETQHLPPQRTQPAQAYLSPRAGHWRDTNDLEPTSVTDNSTRLLEHNDHDQ